MQWWFPTGRFTKVPQVAEKNWSGHPVDKFLKSKMECWHSAERGTDALTILRRLTSPLLDFPYHRTAKGIPGDSR